MKEYRTLHCTHACHFIILDFIVITFIIHHHFTLSYHTQSSTRSTNSSHFRLLVPLLVEFHVRLRLFFSFLLNFLQRAAMLRAVLAIAFLFVRPSHDTGIVSK